MNLAIVSHYSKFEFGNCDIPDRLLNNRYIVLYEFGEIETIKELIDIYKNCLNYYKHNLSVMLVIIKNKYVLNNITFCNINFEFSNFITMMKDKYKSRIKINKKWSDKFKKLRGRYPNVNDFSLLD